MLSLTQRQLESAAADLFGGIYYWRLSRALAWQDIKQRYRRSTLGPLWLTLSSGVQMLTMGYISTFLFNAPIQKSLPFVAAGLLMWGMITQMINEGSSLFISSAAYLLQVRRPYSVFILQLMWRNVIVAAHNAVTFIVVAIIFRVTPGPSLLLWPFAFVLVLVCTGWVVLLSAILATRYRDIPVIIANILTVLFWFTPVMYFPEQLGQKRYLVDYNPLTHLVSLLRDPFLGQTPTLNNWLIVLALAIAGWVFTFLFFARFRTRIVYWL